MSQATCLGSGMPSLPASQPAEDGEADGATAPRADDPFSEEPPSVLLLRKKAALSITGNNNRD